MEEKKLVNSFNLEDALKSGITAEQMMDDFAKQLTAAQKKVASEKTNKDLDKSRDELINAAIDYSVKLGIVSSDILEDKEFKKGLYDTLIEIEADIVKTKPLLDMLKTTKNELEKKGLDPDDIIESFLRTLS